MSNPLKIEEIKLGTIIKGSNSNGGEVVTHQGNISARNQAKNISFSLDSYSYVYFSLLDTNYDLDLEIYRDIKKGGQKNELLVTSDNEGVDGESVFKVLGAGDYTAFLYPYSDATYPVGGVNYTLEIDTKTFLENTLLPNDPLFGSQWHLFNTGQGTGSDNSDIMAPEGWKIQSTSRDIIVAVIDGGVDQKHPDLVKNLWVNPGEIKNNNKDDDANGFIDDVHGWNFFYNTNIISGDDHGTHVAGTIGATGNNGIGVTGVTWDTQLMSLAVFEATEEGAGDIVSAIKYAADNGARVINMSLGLDYEGSIDDYIAEFPDDHKLYFDALTYAVNKGATIVIAAGNANNSFDSNWISSPAYFSEIIPGVISVAASGNSSQRAEYSNYGSRVTITAPGGDFYSSGDSVISDGLFATYPLRPQETDDSYFKNGYGYMQGTSMATPVVTGAIALLLQKHPELKPAEVAEAIVRSAPTSKALQDVSKNGGYLDLYSLLTYFEAEDAPEPVVLPVTETGSKVTIADTSSPDNIVTSQDSPDLIEIKAPVNAVLNALTTETHGLGLVARNVGSKTTAGTGQVVPLKGLGKYTFVATAIPEASTTINLEPAKDTAFFLHDAYSAFYTGLKLAPDSSGRQSHQRVLDVDTIFMGSGGGTSIVDLTSKDYVTGAVTVFGADKGRSIFWGTDANDTYISRGGDSVIFGGAGSNSASLGIGRDTLQYRAGVGAVDRVEGFDRTKDAVELWIGKDMVTIEPQFSSLNGSTLMQWGGNTVEFVGIADLTLSNLKVISRFA